jgi:hypothetical protein
MKFSSKQELLDNIEKEHVAFLSLLTRIPKYRYRDKGVWGDDWTVKDLLAHLTEWEQMFLRWHREGREGKKPAVPAQGFKWNQTPLLNQAIWRKHRRKALDKVIEDFHASYREIYGVADSLSEEALFSPGYYSWTGENTLTTYLAANTFSHYRTASKILRRWLRSQNRL